MPKPPDKTMILLTVILMDLLSGMEFDLFVPSFPVLQNHFALSPSWVAALLSVNFAGYCFSLFFLGDLSDRYGRKPVIVLGLITFVIGSMLCVWPLSYAFLVAGRLLQGLGIAAPAILSFLVIADAYPLKEQKFLMGILNGTMNLAVAAAPVIGSYLTLYFHWQGNFIALLLLGMLVLTMTILFIPHQRHPEQMQSVSLYGISGYITLFKSGALVLLMTNLLFIFVPYWIFVGMSPLLYIRDLGVSLEYFGYYQGIMAFVFALGSILYGLFLKQYNPDEKRMLFISILIFFLSMMLIGLVVFVDSSNPLFITFAIVVFVIGQIIPTTVLYPVCLNFIANAKGRVSAVIQGGRLILTSVSLQVASYYYTGSFRSIGIVMIGFIMIATITLYFVLNNKDLMKSDIYAQV